jgi:TonB-dependent Receptor Plug Domain
MVESASKTDGEMPAKKSRDGIFKLRDQAAMAPTHVGIRNLNKDSKMKKTKMKKTMIIAVLLCALPMLAQSNTGELRLTVSDPSGLGVKSTVDLVSEANQYRYMSATDDHGDLDIKRLPYGIYQLQIKAPAFAQLSESVEIRSALPLDRTIRMKVASVSESVDVSAAATLIDPYRAGSVNEMGQEVIQNRLTSLPGRSMQDLVNSEPGWLYEGNTVLHPRGSEYQTQYVVDGIPLTDNRSPSFGPEPADADDIESLTIYTAGIPAEFGRKMGGVVEVNTLRNEDTGFHGQLSLFGGTFDSAGIDTQDQYTWKGNTLGLSASGDMTSHYLNPVVPENYTNNGTIGSFSLSYERDLTPKDRLTMIVRHELARYQIPNELVQQNGAFLPDADNVTGCPPAPPEPSDCVFIPGGQLQTGDNFETMGIVSYQHIFSSDSIGVLRGMSRDNSLDFYSNPASWPLNATQHNDLKEIYFNGSLSVHHGRQEWKAGVESDNIFLHENTSYAIPDCADPNDPQCPINLGILDSGTTSFAFLGSRPDIEQAAYIQDAIRLGNWSINAGLRWDHYQLLVNQNAVSPRIAVSRYFPSLGLNVHASYDRIFQTPSFENILLASSTAAEAIDTSVAAVQLPVQPSHGNYYELGATKAFLGKLRLDANMFRRQVNNYADDSQILSTGISFPIAFDHAILYGAEVKLDVLQWGRFSGSASYSYIVGNVWNPVTGGLFLGDDATGATTQLTGHFPDSQDQRNSVRARVRYQVAPRLWFALGCDYNSGLPFEPDLTPQQYATEYGQVVVSHLNFNRDRILPYFTQNASVGVGLYNQEKYTVRLQADAANLSNTLEVIDFGGLFSGNALGPSRQYAFRLVTMF